MPLELHAVLEVESVAWSLHEKLFVISLKTYGGSYFKVQLFWSGGAECPFIKGDFYQTDAGDRGGWNLTRLPQSEIDQIHQGRRDYEALSPEDKATRTAALSALVEKHTLDEDVRRAQLRHRAKGDENVCPAIWPEREIPGYNFNFKAIPCQYVEGHSGNHWNGRGAGRGYEWDDSDVDSREDNGLPDSPAPVPAL